MSSLRQTRYLGLMILVLIAALAVFAAACGGDETDTGATGAGETSDLSGSLDGAGATFPEPLYLEWIGMYTNEVQRGVRMNYQGIGSGGGIEQFTQKTVDFGASDAPMTDEELQAAEEAWGANVLHIPTVFGAVALGYNVEGVDSLQLTPDVLADIFLGNVTKWNDPSISDLNEGVELPDQAIQIVHRSDSSGTTNIFTGYMEQISEEWANQVGAGKTVEWPVGVGGQGNDGVAAVVQQQAGSIGYIELSYALENDVPVVTLQNAAGNFVEPSLDSTAAAAVGVEFPEDLRFSVSNSEGEDAYPIVGATWILVADGGYDAETATVLEDYLTWALTEGDDIALDLEYAPIPDELEALALEKVDAIGN